MSRFFMRQEWWNMFIMCFNGIWKSNEQNQKYIAITSLLVKIERCERMSDTNVYHAYSDV